jgi:hypothetical protein
VKRISAFAFGTRGKLDAGIAQERRCSHGSYLDGVVWSERIVVGQDGADAGASRTAEFDANEGATSSDHG